MLPKTACYSVSSFSCWLCYSTFVSNDKCSSISWYQIVPDLASYHGSTWSFLVATFSEEFRRLSVDEAAKKEEETRASCGRGPGVGQGYSAWAARRGEGSCL